MKKKIMTWACSLLAIAMVSCDRTSEYHTTTIYYPYSGRAMVYADQPTDSIWFATTESWTVKSDASWCRVDDYIAKVTNPYVNALVETSGTLYFEPNLTGDWRSAIVTVSGGEYVAQVAYFQAPHLHVIRPNRSYDENGFPTDLYTLTDSATWTIDSISFETFGSWTLASQQGLVEPELISGDAGTHTVRFSFSRNDTAADRLDTLLLTSNGVTDRIPFKQLVLK